MIASTVGPVSTSHLEASERRPAGSDSLVLAVLLIGTFMASLDVSIVNVAAPRIGDDLDASGGALQLIISGYTVAYAGLLVTGARLGDDHGHRRLFLVGLGAFTTTSLLCGLAWNEQVLIASRLVQGASAAMMAPQVLTIMQLRLHGDRRARALALYATVLSAAVVAGQVLGGVLVGADLAGLSWRPVFLVNVPIGAALLFVAPRVVPVTRRPSGKRLDLVGVLVLTAAVAFVIVPLVMGHESGWPLWTWVMLAASLPTAAVLKRHLRRRQRRTGDALFDVALLRRTDVAVGFACVCSQMIAYGGFLFTITLHLQRDLDFSPTRSGATLVPYAVGFAVTSLGVPRMWARWQRPAPFVGLLAAGIGYAALGLVAADGGWPMWVTIPCLALTGAGFGAGYSPMIARTIAHVEPSRAPDASGMFTTINQLSFAIGVAVIGSVYLSDAEPDGRTFAVCVALAGALAAVGAVLSAFHGRTTVVPATGATAESEETTEPVPATPTHPVAPATTATTPCR